MRGLINDCLRRLIGLSIGVAGLLLTGVLWIRKVSFCRNQRRLKRKYRIVANTPVLSYGMEVEALIQTQAVNAEPYPRFATTSGSISKPKRIHYPPKRLRSVKVTYSDVFARACWAFGIKRTSLYVFSSFSKDDSLTSLMLDEQKLPSRLATVQAPYRVQFQPAVQELVSRYGAAAVRLWVLAISNPGVIYSTNPSTISTFLDELNTQWLRTSQLIKDWSEKPESFNTDIRRIGRRLDSIGSAQRLNLIAGSSVPLTLEICAPAISAYMCWTGGYVRPFLDLLAKYLPAPRFQLIPMYSMSTETVETISHFRANTVSFLPLAGRVLYEFLEESKADLHENLLGANELQPEKVYEMIVSDPYGLRRYQTGDLFLCKGTVAGLPDLSFVRRRNLEYSFTGEKLTAEQVSSVFQQLRSQYPALLAEWFLTCVPSKPFSDAIPHYTVLLVGKKQHCEPAFLKELGRRCDEIFGELNHEYKAKRSSGRLGPLHLMTIGIEEFTERIRVKCGWETQFKFLPLYRRTWEEAGRE